MLGRDEGNVMADGMPRHPRVLATDTRAK